MCLFLTGCSAFQPVEQPDDGDVDLSQSHYFWPYRLEFSLTPWEDITKKCRPNNPSKRRYRGCIYPPIFNTRRIEIMDTYEWTMLDIAQHECEHYAYGRKHTGVRLVGNRYEAYPTKPNPLDPQAAVKAEAVEDCMRQFREFIK